MLCKECFSKLFLHFFLHFQPRISRKIYFECQSPWRLMCEFNVYPGLKLCLELCFLSEYINIFEREKNCAWERSSPFEPSDCLGLIWRNLSHKNKNMMAGHFSHLLLSWPVHRHTLSPTSKQIFKNWNYLIEKYNIFWLDEHWTDIFKWQFLEVFEQFLDFWPNVRRASSQPSSSFALHLCRKSCHVFARSFFSFLFISRQFTKVGEYRVEASGSWPARIAKHT